MDDAQQREALKVPDVDGQQLRDAVNVHTGREPGVMNLHALDLVHEEKMPPAVMHVAAVRQQLKIPFDHAGDAIRLVNAQSQPVLVERPGGSIPELAEDLRGKTKPRVSLCELFGVKLCTLFGVLFEYGPTGGSH
jgi:hypothetical protein